MNKRDRLPWALGWASLGIGLTEVLFTEGLRRRLGVPGRHADLIRGLGVREISNGWGLLFQPHRSEWTWARVVGDALDLALLATTFRAWRAEGPWRAAITAAVAGVTLVDLYAATRQGAPRAFTKRTAPSLDGHLNGDMGVGSPMESWRGSGLAEDVGTNGMSADESESEEYRQRMMEEAARKLGLPELKERGSSH